MKFDIDFFENDEAVNAVLRFDDELKERLGKIEPDGLEFDDINTISKEQFIAHVVSSVGLYLVDMCAVYNEDKTGSVSQ